MVTKFDTNLSMLPVFAVTGGLLEDGRVRLFASKDLTRAELQVVVDHTDVTWDGVNVDTRATGYQITLGTRMRHFIIIDAPDWDAAWDYLFKHWSPKPEPKKALGPGQQEIVGSPTGRLEYPSRPQIGQ